MTAFERHRRWAWVLVTFVGLAFSGCTDDSFRRVLEAIDSDAKSDTERGWILFPPYTRYGVMTQNALLWVTTGAYGERRVFAALHEAANDLRIRYPDANVAYLDASGRKRGKLRFHKSHQNGLDIDVLYLGRAWPFDRVYPKRPSLFVIGYALRYGKNRRCLNLTWDAERNWAWLMALRRQNEATITNIFVEDYIREWYLEEGKRQGASAEELRWARDILDFAGPNAASHKDHMHIRFSAN